MTASSTFDPDATRIQDNQHSNNQSVSENLDSMETTCMEDRNTESSSIEAKLTHMQESIFMPTEPSLFCETEPPVQKNTTFPAQSISPDLEATRICTIDPQTGKIISSLEQPVSASPCRKTDSQYYDCGDATIGMIPSSSDNDVCASEMAEFVPIIHQKAVGEATTLWTPQAEQIQKIRNWFLQNRRRLVLLTASILVAIIIPLAALQANPETPQPKSTSPNKTVKKSKKSMPAQTAKPELKATLKEAATWLINGDYDKARSAYRYLARHHPENPSFALSQNILERQEEYQ